MPSFFDLYLKYVHQSEAPVTFHRWASFSAVAALLEKSVWIEHGHFKIFPNMYIMLMGTPGSRKSSTVSIASKVLERVGYKKFAPDRCSKEMLLKVLMNSASNDTDEISLDQMLDRNSVADAYVAADEFVDFAGNNNIELLIMLGKLWDAPSVYTHPKLRSQDVIVENPCLNMLSGNTPSGMTKAVPPDANDVGFMSRVLFIRGIPTGEKITFPEPPPKKHVDAITQRFLDIKEGINGAMAPTKAAVKATEQIYKDFPGLEDPRFFHYSTRRLAHLLKLSLVIAASELKTEIDEETVVNANTVLHVAEQNMAHALGEYGRARHSEAINQILSYMREVRRPVVAKELWKVVHNDLNSIKDLTTILQNLAHAEKIHSKGEKIYLVAKPETGWSENLINFDFLTENERHCR